jgi:excisionase family DNA binding protein
METIPMNVHRPSVSITKACELAGVTRRTIYNWLKAGKVESIRTAGGSIRIYADSLFRPSDHQRQASMVGTGGR